MPPILIRTVALCAAVLVSACSENISRVSDAPPDAEAGEFQIVDLDSSVLLDATASDDIGDDELSYFWEQTGGDSVILIAQDDSIAQFTAPAEEADLTFQVTVTDNSGQQDTDSTIVYVRNRPSVELVLATNVIDEDGGFLGVRFSFSRATSTTSTINLTFGGNAQYDADYYLAKSVFIPVDSLAYDTAIDIYDNELQEENKTLTVAIAEAAQFRFDEDLTYGITIIDDDTAPEFTSSNEHEADDRRLDTDYIASASDADGDILLYSIIGGDDAAAFSLDDASGVLLFSEEYFDDFYLGSSNVPLVEQPADTNADNVYELLLQASDGTNNAELNLNVYLEYNDNTLAPNISSSQSVSTNEGQNGVFYTAVADNSENDELTWSISGKDSAYLQISTVASSYNGELSFVEVMDYENPLDIEPKDNIYEINLSVSDGRYSDQQELNISLSNVAEAAPELTINSDEITATSLTLNWEAMPGAISYHIYQSTDYDCLSGQSITSCADVIYHVESEIISQIVDDLQSYTDYFFVMSAESEDSYSDFTEIELATTLIATPSSISLNTLSNSEIHLSWPSVNNAESYNLFRYSNAGCNIEVNYQACADALYTSNITATEFLDSGLDRDSVYYYQLEVLAENLVKSDPSEQYSATTAEYHLYNDTGITYSGKYSSGDLTYCGELTDTNIDAEQDCDTGRDADSSLSKIGDGVAAFDFTKLASDGTVLGVQNDEWSTDGDESIGTSWSCVRDNTTELVWQVNSVDQELYNWGGTTALTGGSGTYYSDWNEQVDLANSSMLCGLSDWRVPTLDELMGLSYMHKDSAEHIDSHYFPNITGSTQYWTALPRGNQALVFYQAWSLPQSLATNDEAYLRLVSGTIRGYDWEEGRYQDNNDGTITDLETNLLWAKCAGGMEYDTGGNVCQGNSSAVNWRDALEAAGASELAGHSDWRLPNAKELQTLSVLSADGSSGISAHFILDGTETYLHSSTPYPGDSGNSYQLSLSTGLTISRIRTGVANYLLVRIPN